MKNNKIKLNKLTLLIRSVRINLIYTIFFIQGRVLVVVVVIDNQNAGHDFHFLYSLTALKRATLYYMNFQMLQSNDVKLTCISLPRTREFNK